MRAILLSLIVLTSLSSLANDAFVDNETGFAFPQSIAGFSFADKSQYDDPALGYGLNYWSEKGILITVIVFDLGKKDIPDGIDGALVRKMMEQAQEDVDEVVNQGLYRSVRVLDDVGPFSPLFLSASYSVVRADGARLRSYVFIRGKNRKLVKVKATGPESRSIDADVAKFILELSTKIISRGHR